MEVCTTKLPADLFRPRSLAVLMGVYETNYRRLLDLLGEPSSWPERFCLHLPDRPPLHAEVRTRARYTVDLVMTYRFGAERLPDLTVRLYRDARLAEAAPLDGNRTAEPLVRLPARWQANLLLYKWLEYCLDAGRSGGGRRQDLQVCAQCADNEALHGAFEPQAGVRQA